MYVVRYMLLKKNSQDLDHLSYWITILIYLQKKKTKQRTHNVWEDSDWIKQISSRVLSFPPQIFSELFENEILGPRAILTN